MPTQLISIYRQIEFDAGTNLQKVELVTLIQDAVFLYPKRFADGTTETLPLGDERCMFLFDENDPINGNELVFTNQNPMLYGYAAIPAGKKQSLMLDPMYISTQTWTYVSNNASLNINGSKSNSTLFENEVV
jgi:hypothetical protein